MVNKELKRLSRRELVDIIYQMKKNEQEMQEEIASLKEALEDRRIKISEAGSIADAALSVTGVFSAAQDTADVYLKEIADMKEDTKKECERKLEEAEKEVEKIMADAENQFEELKAHYQAEYEKCQKLHEEIERLENMKK